MGISKKIAKPGSSLFRKTKCLLKRRLGHASFSLLNKLVQKDLVRGLPKSKFMEHKVCDACARGKHVKSSFKPNKDVRTSKPLDLLHMDLSGHMRVQSKGGKRYIFVIVDDYSKFTWTLFLRTNDETFEVFVAFVKKNQVKMDSKVAYIRSDHGTEFDNTKYMIWSLLNKTPYLSVPGEVIDMANGKTDMMSQVKDPSEDNAVSSAGVEPDATITTTEDKERVVDAVQEPKNIKEPLKDADWITAMQDELHQFERNNVWHLALYGLKQAPRDWYEILSKFLFENGFTRERIDNALFLKKRGRNIFIVQVYVDDIIFGATADSLCEEFEKLTRSEFKMSMMESKVIDTLIATATRLDMDESGSPVNQTMYRGIIGSLLYLTASRPDIVFSVGLCDNFNLIGYADADYVGYLVDMKTSCCAQLLWIKQQLKDFRVYTDCVPLLCDNTSALSMAKNLVQHKRTKHIDARHYFLRDNVEKGLICMKFCSTENQITNIFTKALSREYFERNRLELGLIKPNGNLIPISWL
uniref:Uncharacterized protein LOC104217756 n=1 Tax=Nicotiana sylvestris TaxID=4096 RepID=A0A1U7VVD6_NICSY|nr:PREDICTED: uncharacterized protein LOC104217756 [Nicotiana sylvestris]